MNVEKLIENVMRRNESSDFDLYGLIEYAVLMDEEYNAKEIDIDIIKKIIRIIDKPLSNSDIDYLEDEDKVYDDISLELSEISSKDKEKVKEGLKYLIDLYDSRKSIHWKKSDIQFEFHPKDEAVFKRLFILVGQANRYFYLNDKKEPIKNTWTRISFSMYSNLKACIFSSACYRENLKKGIKKIKLEIPFCEKYEDYSLEQIDNEIDDIEQHIFEEKQKRINLRVNFEITRIAKTKDVSFPLPSSTCIEKKTQIPESHTLTSEEEYKIGCDFYKEGVYEKALKHLTNSAEQGNDDARLEIVNIYYDDDVFFKLKHFPIWLNESFYQDNPKANFLLGYMYFLGKGVNQDFSKALLLWQKATTIGESKSQFCLSCMYRDGIGVENNIEKAKELWNKCKDSLTLSTINQLNEIFPRNL